MGINKHLKVKTRVGHPLFNQWMMLIDTNTNTDRSTHTNTATNTQMRIEIQSEDTRGPPAVYPVDVVN